MRHKAFLSYSPYEGWFTLKLQVPGLREPVTRKVSQYEIDRIGDMDVSNMAKAAMHFPNRDHLVQSHRLHV